MKCISCPTKRKRVCFVSLEIHPTTPGGAGILIRHTATKLLRDGYEILLVLDIAKHEFDRFRSQDRLLYPFPERVHAFSVSELCGADVDVPICSDPEYHRSIRICRALEALLARESIDLIEIYDYCGPAWHFLATPSAAKVRTVIRLHNTIELIDRKVRNPLSKSRLLHYAMERGQIALADALLSPGSRYFAEEIVPIYPEARDGRHLNSAPVFYPLGEVAPESDPRNVLFYGRLSTFKGLDTFLRGSVVALEDRRFEQWLADFIIIGPEETVASSLTLDEMKAVIPERHSERFKFYGRVEHDRLIKMLPNVAFAAFANRMESFCYAAHEVHNAGVPVIVSETAAFRDFFEDGRSAVFFDGTAQGLGAAMRRLAADPKLRAELSAFGAARAESYLFNHYDSHFEAITPRRRIGAVSPKITALIFSSDNRQAEAETLASTNGVCANAVVLRPTAQRGWRISGTHFRAEISDRPNENVDLEPLGNAIIGLHAGDRVHTEWLTQAAALLAADDKIGAIGCWREGLVGVEMSPSNLVPEAGLLDQMGLRQLIRIREGLVFSELAGEMKASGEAGLIFAARAAGQVALESPRIGVDTRGAIATPLFDLDAAISVDFAKINPNFFALQNALGIAIGQTGVSARRSAAFSRPEELTAALDQGRCIVRARPDIEPGEVWLLRAYPRDGELRTPWSAITFTGHWEQRNAEKGATQARVCTWWGEASFPARPDSAIELLKGAFCGACEIIYGGVRTLVRLRTSKTQSVRLRLSDVIGLTQAADVVISARDSRPRKFPITVRACVANEYKTVVVADSGSWLLARTALASVPLHRMGIADIVASRGGVVETAARLTQRARAGELERLVVALSSETSLELIDVLSRATSPLSLTAVLTPDAAAIDHQHHYAADIAAIGRLHRIVRARPDAFTIVSPDKGLLPAFDGLGARTMKLTCFPRTPQLDPTARGAISFCVLGHSRMVPVRTHLLAAALILRTRVDSAACILIPSDDEHLLEVAQEFGAQNIKRYRQVQDVAPALGERRLALGVFPDAETPVDIEYAAELGCLPLVGPADLWGEGAPELQVAYWEDAAAIAEAGEAALTNWRVACEAATDAAHRAQRAALAQAGQLLGSEVVLDQTIRDQSSQSTRVGGI